MRKFTKYPVTAAEGVKYAIAAMREGQLLGYVFNAAQSRGTYMLRISKSARKPKAYSSSAGAARALGQYKYANELYIYEDGSMPVMKYSRYLSKEFDDLKKWDDKIQLKVVPYGEAVEGSYTLDSIEKARATKIPGHVLLSMHSAILSMLESEYPRRDFQVMVQPDNNKSRPALDIAVESWESMPGATLAYKVYVDDPTVIYWGDNSVSEEDFDVDDNISEMIRERIHYYLNGVMKYAEI